MERTFADFSGSWKMKSSENFEELLKALGKFESRILDFVYMFFLHIFCVLFTFFICCNHNTQCIVEKDVRYYKYFGLK